MWLVMTALMACTHDPAMIADEAFIDTRVDPIVIEVGEPNVKLSWASVFEDRSGHSLDPQGWTELTERVYDNVPSRIVQATHNCPGEPFLNLRTEEVLALDPGETSWTVQLVEPVASVQLDGPDQVQLFVILERVEGGPREVDLDPEATLAPPLLDAIIDVDKGADTLDTTGLSDAPDTLELQEFQHTDADTVAAAWSSGSARPDAVWVAGAPDEAGNRSIEGADGSAFKGFSDSHVWAIALETGCGERVALLRVAPDA